MAVVSHTDKSLAEIEADLTKLAEGISALRKAMKAAGTKELGFDTEKGQVMGRTAIHSFIASGQLKLRRLADSEYLKGLGEGGG